MASSEINQELSPEIDPIVQKLCAYDPDDRYSDWNEVVEELSIIGIL